MDITVFIKNGCCGGLNLQLCLPILLRSTNNQLIFFQIKNAVDLRKCLPIAVREFNKDRLIFLHIKRCGGSSKMPSYRCEKHQQ